MSNPAVYAIVPTIGGAVGLGFSVFDIRGGRWALAGERPTLPEAEAYMRERVIPHNASAATYYDAAGVLTDPPAPATTTLATTWPTPAPSTQG